jgi:hypothetical protein
MTPPHLSEEDLLAYLTSPATSAALPMDFTCEISADYAVVAARLCSLGFTVTAEQVRRDSTQHIHVEGLRFSSTVTVALLDDPLTCNGTRTP